MEKFLELTETQLNALRDEFIETDGLSVQQFVGVMLRLLPPVSRDERLHLVYQLSDLFAQVDINGDGTMEFDEFTLFFISAGRSGLCASVHTLHSTPMRRRHDKERIQAPAVVRLSAAPAV